MGWAKPSVVISYINIHKLGDSSICVADQVTEYPQTRTKELMHMMQDIAFQLAQTLDSKNAENHNG